MLFSRLSTPVKRVANARLISNVASTKFKISNLVKAALNSGQPVVALESTIISHGMPYPQNVETALAVEDIIVKHGAVPATIAILEGKVHIGLEKDELEQLGNIGKSARKTSRRDIPFVLANSLTGATTVAGTMVLAHAAGIPVFVTGGIGGAHRGAEKTMDISADLMELGKTPVAVVCAGAKSILDIPKTLEILETQGVPVTTIGKSAVFPAFYTPDSGVMSPCQVPDALAAAKMIHANQEMELQNGMVFAVPIPAEHAADGRNIAKAIGTAIKEASDNDVQGKEATPFLLKRITEITKGDSLKANIALVKNNAAIGAQIAVELANLKKLTAA
ncbi:indigoidine synthase A family protein [Umbelopsis sp. PMI_123]|nr:indigoidine synthase A family protein [Umbelopsis sp. PMI_123]